MDILNTETNEVTTLSLTDPKTNTDMLEDFAPIKEDANITYNKTTEQYEANSDTIDWWGNCLAEYQQLENKMYTIKTDGSEDARAALDAILADALGCEFNNYAGHVLAAITDKISDTDITVTDFDCNYHGCEIHESSNTPAYVRHNIDVYNEVLGLSAVYQNAQHYYHSNYSTPSTEFELSKDGGTDNALMIINALDVEDIDGFTEDDVAQVIKDIYHDSIKTKADIYAVHAALKKNNIKAQEYATSIEEQKGDESE